MDEGELIILLHRSEGETLDFKQQYAFSGASDDHKSELLKDILALANAWKDAPAHLVVGVTEQDGRASAFPGVTVHLADHTLQQFVNARTNAPIRFEVETIPYQGVHLDIIRIAKEQERPLFLTKDYGRLKKNVVYVRRGSSTAEASPKEIADMGRSDAIAGTASVPNVLVELADPHKRERWGTTANVICTTLLDSPPPPARKPEPGDVIKKLGRPSHFMRTTLDPMAHLNPSSEEWIAYMKGTARISRVSFWAQNVGTVNVSNARVEIRISQQDGVVIESGHRGPRKPRSTFELIQPTTPKPSIFVEHEGDEYAMSFDLGNLQPKADFWKQGNFIVAAKASCEIPIRVRIYADNLANPLESTLTLKVQVISRAYTRADEAAARGLKLGPSVAD